MTTLNRLPILFEAMPKTRKDASTDHASIPNTIALLETSQNTWDIIAFLCSPALIRPIRSLIAGFRILRVLFEDILRHNSQRRLMYNSFCSRALFSKED